MFNGENIPIEKRGEERILGRVREDFIKTFYPLATDPDIIECLCGEKGGEGREIIRIRLNEFLTRVAAELPGFSLGESGDAIPDYICDDIKKGMRPTDVLGLISEKIKKAIREGVN